VYTTPAFTVVICVMNLLRRRELKDIKKVLSTPHIPLYHASDAGKGQAAAMSGGG